MAKDRWLESILKKEKISDIEYSDDGNSWHQLRIARLHGNFATLNVGIYACSPNEKVGFEAIFDRFSLVDSDWRRPDKANGE